MTCPEDGPWFDKDNKEISKAKTYEQEYDNTKKGPYRCDYGDPKTKYYFYVQGKGE